MNKVQVILGSVIAVVTSAVTTSAQDQLSYNLLCTGFSTTVSASNPNGAFGAPQVSWSQTYRLNPAAEAWCEGQCMEIEHLRVEENKLILRSEGGGDSGRVERLIINRRIGEIDGISGKGSKGQWVGLRIIIAGHCSKQPFTKFPKLLF